MPKEPLKKTSLAGIRRQILEKLSGVIRKERRRRLKRPFGLKLFIAAYFLIPVINYFSMAVTFSIYPPYIDIMLEKMTWFEIMINLLAIVAGAGLLSSVKAGFLLCMIFTPLLFIHKSISFVLEASAYNIAAIIEIFFCAASIIFFTSKDVYSPFMNKKQKIRRGWRFHIRRPIRMAVSVNGERVFTRDMSADGVYTTWKECNFKPGREVRVCVTVDKEAYDLKAGITRIDPDGAALAFRAMDNKTGQKFHRDLQRLEIKKELKSTQKEGQ